MQSQQPTPSTKTDDAVPAMAADAVQRRRMLLKGLGKGSAVVAMVAPIQTLAAINPLPNRLCTVSGVQSNVGSGRTGGTLATCEGFSITYFNTLSNWPNYQGNGNGNSGSSTFTVGGLSRTQNSSFSAVFGSGSNTSLFQVITQNNASASEKIWVAAMLSAVKKSGITYGQLGYFPYTADEVVALFQSSRKAEAELFFKNYLIGL